MSDDWGSYRRELGDEDERDDADVAREDTGGWAEDEPETAHFRSHWPDDEPGQGEESPSAWPSPGSTCSCSRSPGSRGRRFAATG